MWESIVTMQQMLLWLPSDGCLIGLSWGHIWVSVCIESSPWRSLLYIIMQYLYKWVTSIFSDFSWYKLKFTSTYKQIYYNIKTNTLHKIKFNVSKQQVD